mmetsp:Transcript_42290/g.108877  ORF Transcript_42290/g.108877 Transcript_42290/m.108877 type:complete len:376 (-) Transcript_42290:110-1237(-)
MGKDSNLHIAAQEGNLDAVKKLVEEGADVDSQGQKLYTSLHFAAKNGRADVVEFLVESGANVLAKALSSSNATVPRVTALDLATDIDVVAILKPLYEEAEKHRQTMGRVRVSMAGKKLFTEGEEGGADDAPIEEEFENLLEGFMLKEGGGTTWKSRKNWTKRFFVLKKGEKSGTVVLTYAKQSGEDTLNQFIIDETCEVKRAAREGVALCFALVTKGRTLFARASSATMYDSWIGALESAIQARRELLGEGNRILFEGFLLKEGSTVKTWKKRWVRLVHTPEEKAYLVTYKASPADLEDLGSFSLDAQSNVEQVDELSFKIVTAERTFDLKLVSGNQSEEMSEWLETLQSVVRTLQGKSDEPEKVAKSEENENEE